MVCLSFILLCIIIHYWTKGKLESWKQNTKGLKRRSIWREGTRNYFSQYSESYTFPTKIWYDGDLEFFFSFGCWLTSSAWCFKTRGLPAFSNSYLKNDIGCVLLGCSSFTHNPVCNPLCNPLCNPVWLVVYWGLVVEYSYTH